MPTRTQLYQISPWQGGLNTTIDPAVLDPQALTVADNITIDRTPSRKKRQGIGYWDYVATATTRSSSSFTRTLILDAASAGTFTAGQKVSVSHGSVEDEYDGKEFTIATVTTTTNPDDTLTYLHPTALTEAPTAVTVRLSRVDETTQIIGLFDFWRIAGGGSRVRETIAVNSAGTIYKYDDSGQRTTLTNSGTALTAPTRVSFAVMNNILIMGFDGATNVPKKYNPNVSAVVADLSGTPPNFSIVRSHLGRLWTNDKANPDRIHYTQTASPEIWNGSGDSGAFDIARGDGDALGIRGIFPTFRGELVVGKGARLYRISGFIPEELRVELMSNGIGSAGHEGIVPVDQDEIFFVSSRGFHAMSTTASFGDLEASFLSLPIQSDFTTFTDFENIKGVYLPQFNSIAWAVNRGGAVTNTEIYLYNIAFKAWYRWPNIEAVSIATRTEGEKRRLYIGTANNRILQTDQSRISDFGLEPIIYRVRTGVIYPDNQIYTIKAFKRLILLYRPRGNFNFTAKVKIDNYNEQTLTYTQFVAGAELGNDFVLGQSALGQSPALAPFALPIDGYGHGIRIEISQDVPNQGVEIHGFALEYEVAGSGQETIAPQGIGEGA